MRNAELRDQRRSALLPPVLCYHRIGGPVELGVTRIAGAVFARQMNTLARAGWRVRRWDRCATNHLATDFSNAQSRKLSTLRGRAEFSSPPTRQRR